MRAVVQRVSRASVTVVPPGGDPPVVTGAIGRGFVVLLGVQDGDTSAEGNWLAAKIAGLRVFEDSAGKMNLALADVAGQVLVVSQFTLLGDCRHGRRPGFDAAARPEVAIPLYEQFVAALRAAGLTVETGQFQTEMRVELVNDGPVTLLLDSRKLF